MIGFASSLLAVLMLGPPWLYASSGLTWARTAARLRADPGLDRTREAYRAVVLVSSLVACVAFGVMGRITHPGASDLSWAMDPVGNLAAGFVRYWFLFGLPALLSFLPDRALDRRWVQRALVGIAVLLQCAMLVLPVANALRIAIGPRFGHEPWYRQQQFLFAVYYSGLGIAFPILVASVLLVLRQRRARQRRPFDAVRTSLVVSAVLGAAYLAGCSAQLESFAATYADFDTRMPIASRFARSLATYWPLMLALGVVGMGAARIKLLSEKFLTDRAVGVCAMVVHLCVQLTLVGPWLASFKIATII